MPDAKDEEPSLLQKWQKLFLYGKIFAVLVFVESIILVVIQIIVQSDNVPRCSSPPCRTQTNDFYSISIYILVVFMCHYAYAGLKDDNMFEIFAFMAVTLLIFFYSIILVSSNPDWHFVLYMVVTTICSIAYIFLVYKIYLEIGWYIYKRIGANQEMRDMYRSAQLFLAMIKFDLLFSLLLVVLAGLYYLAPNNYEFYLTLFAFILTFVWAYLGWVAVKGENEVYMNVYMCLAVVEPVFIIYKLVRLSQTVQKLPVSLFVVATVAEIIIRTYLMVTAVIARRNFGKGLLNEVFQVSSKKSRPLQAASHADLSKA